jgi:hypothetical protein
MTAQLASRGSDAQASTVNCSGQTTVVKPASAGMTIQLFSKPGFGNIKHAQAAGDSAELLFRPCVC